MTIRIQRRIAMVHLGPGAPPRDQLGEVLAASPGVLRSSLLWHHPRSVGAGQATWDAHVTHREPAPEPAGVHLDLVEPVTVAWSVPEPDLAPCVKRTLFLAVEPGAPAEAVARMEADLAAMPTHIDAIRNWALSRVAGPPGSRWTHVWEQEFADLDGVLGDYLLHPHHWGHVDRWFDPEHPARIVDTALAHAVAPTDVPVLAWALAVRR